MPDTHVFVLTFHKLLLKNYCNPNKIRGKHLTRATAPPPINNRFPQKVQKELHAFSAKTTIKAKISGKRCICLVIFPDKVEFQGKNASKCNPITQITEKELPSPHKATSPRPNAHCEPIPKTPPISPLPFIHQNRCQVFRIPVNYQKKWWL